LYRELTCEVSVIGTGMWWTVILSEEQ